MYRSPNMFLLSADFPRAEGQKVWNSSSEEGLYCALKAGPSPGRQARLLRERRYSGTPATSTVPPPLEVQLFPRANARTEEPLLQPTPSLTPLWQGLWCKPEAAPVLRESTSLTVVPTSPSALVTSWAFTHRVNRRKARISASFVFKSSTCLMTASHCIIYKRHTALSFLNTTRPILNTSLNWILSYAPWLRVEIYCFKVKGEELNYYPGGCLYTSMIHPLVLPWGWWELHGLVKNRAKYSSADWQGCPS